MPSKAQRDMCHLILGSLGFNDNRILDQYEIVKMDKYLSLLVDSERYLYPVDGLSASGIYNSITQETNKDRLKLVLKDIKEKRSYA